jgi:GGDEF domain-containing protein
MTGSAEDQLERLVSELKVSLMSDGQLSETLFNVLDSAAIGGAIFRVSVTTKTGAALATYKPREFEIYARSGEVERRPFQMQAINYTIEVWWEQKTSLQSIRERLISLLCSALNLHWGERDTLVLLPRLQDAQTGPRATAFLQKIAADGQPVVLIQVDLDHFGELNKTEKDGTWDLGDQVIAEFASRFRTLSDLGVLLRTGAGDEFSAIFANCDAATILERVEAFRHTWNKRPSVRLRTQRGIHFHRSRRAASG